MLPIVDYPSTVREYGGYFRTLFSKMQFKHCQEYLTGLIVSDNVTVTGINSRFVNANDQSSLNKFLTTYSWDEGALNAKRLELLQGNNKTRWNKHGVVNR